MSDTKIIRISVTEARANFSQMCREAELGKTVIVMKHNVPYMKIVSLLPVETYNPDEQPGKQPEEEKKA